VAGDHQVTPGEQRQLPALMCPPLAVVTTVLSTPHVSETLSTYQSAAKRHVHLKTVCTLGVGPCAPCCCLVLLPCLAWISQHPLLDIWYWSTPQVLAVADGEVQADWPHPPDHHHHQQQQLQQRHRDCTSYHLGAAPSVQGHATAATTGPQQQAARPGRWLGLVANTASPAAAAEAACHALHCRHEG
jgi:hypothetical protein